MRLDVFSQKKLYDALHGAGYDVSARTVRRWVEGEAQPDSAWQAAILSVLGTKKTAAEPDWARRLTDDLLGEIRKNRTEILEAIGTNLARELAKYGLEKALNERSHDEPTPETGGSTPTGAAQP